MDRPSIVRVEGELVVSDADGGFGPDLVEVGGRSLAELFGIDRDGRGSLGEFRRLGPVRLTLERLEGGGPRG